MNLLLIYFQKSMGQPLHDRDHFFVDLFWITWLFKIFITFYHMYKFFEYNFLFLYKGIYKTIKTV